VITGGYGTSSAEFRRRAYRASVDTLENFLREMRRFPDEHAPPFEAVPRWRAIKRRRQSLRQPPGPAANFESSLAAAVALHQRSSDQ
jgi:hypothetical protein